MKRIAIIGSPGAGKSTFARALSDALDLPLYHLDRLMWKPGWILVSREDQIRLQEEIVGRDSWILDGNYGATMGIRLEAADTVIFLDRSRYVCLYHVLKRRIQYRNTPRPDMTEGNPERLNTEFLRYVWSFPKDKRPALLESVRQLKPNQRLYTAKSTRDVKRLLNSLTP